MFPVLSFNSPSLSEQALSSRYEYETLLRRLQEVQPSNQRIILDGLFQELYSEDVRELGLKKFAFLHNQGWDLETVALQSVRLNDFSYLLEDIVKKAANAPHPLLRQRAYWICCYLIRHSYERVYQAAEDLSSWKLCNLNRYEQQEGLAYYALLFQRKPDAPFQENAKILELARKVAEIFALSDLPIENSSARLFNQALNDFQIRRSCLSQNRGLTI